MERHRGQLGPLSGSSFRRAVPKKSRLGQGTRIWWSLCASLPLLAGCKAALWGNMVVLAVSLGIFWGTLSLKRQAASDRSGRARAASLDQNDLAEPR